MYGRPLHALLRRRMRERVAHPVNAAPLMCGVEHAAGSGAQALVVVGDDQLHATQAAIGERPQEVGLERLGFGGAGRDAQHLALAILVHRHGDYHSTADDPAALAHLQVGRVEP